MRKVLLRGGIVGATGLRAGGRRGLTIAGAALLLGWWGCGGSTTPAVAPGTSAAPPPTAAPSVWVPPEERPTPLESYDPKEGTAGTAPSASSGATAPPAPKEPKEPRAPEAKAITEDVTGYVITVGSRGEKPRALLRSDFSKKKGQSVSWHGVTSFIGAPIPMTLTADTKIHLLAPKPLEPGLAAFDYRIEKYTVTGAPPGAAPPSKEVTGTIHLDERLRVRKEKTSAGPDDPTLADSFDALPLEPMGVGGTWQVEIQRDGRTIRGSYRLDSVEDKRFTITVDRQISEPGKSPQLEKGTVTYRSGRPYGTGSLEVTATQASAMGAVSTKTALTVADL